MIKYPQTDAQKIEKYRARKHEAIFDRVDYAVNLVPGHNGKGAVVKSFIDAIKIHDEVVKQVEERWIQIDELKRDLLKKTRLFRNMDAAWTALNLNPDAFNEFQELQPRMKNIRERISRMKNFKARARAETELERYEELLPQCTKLMDVRKELDRSRDIRDEARRILTEAEDEFALLRNHERDTASRITDDHIVADEKRISMGELYPNVHLGHVIHSINGHEVIHMDFEEAIVFIKRARSPHRMDFRRYDFKFDALSGNWFSNTELRELGACFEDPQLSHSKFVETAARGDIQGLKLLLQQGEDPDAVDYTGCSAVHVAAANGHDKILDILKKAGADMDKRDVNMMTPFLCCLRKGNLEMVWKLTDFSVDKAATDRNGFSPLHMAAYQGSLELVQNLLTAGCSIYLRDLQGRTPEFVAKDANRSEIVALLEQERLSAFAQHVYMNSSLELNIWIGEEGAMNPDFCSTVDITHVIYLAHSPRRPAIMQWLNAADEAKAKLFVFEVPLRDDDATTRSWTELNNIMPEILEVMLGILKKGNASILICDPTGKSSCAGVFVTVMLLKFQIRTMESLGMCVAARPFVSVSISILTGLEMLQRSFDAKKLQRLEKKMKHSIMASCAF